MTVNLYSILCSYDTVGLAVIHARGYKAEELKAKILEALRHDDNKAEDTPTSAS